MKNKWVNCQPSPKTTMIKQISANAANQHRHKDEDSEKSVLLVDCTNELVFSDMENAGLRLLLAFLFVLWIYSYNLMVRGLRALLTVSLHYCVDLHNSLVMIWSQVFPNTATPYLYSPHRHTLAFHPVLMNWSNPKLLLGQFHWKGQKRVCGCKSMYSLFHMKLWEWLSDISTVQLGKWTRGRK